MRTESLTAEGIRAAINERTHLVRIQRSKGYAPRKTLSVERIGKLIAFIKDIKPDVICMVDNCYGEFVEEREPIEVGEHCRFPHQESGRRTCTDRRLYCRQKNVWKCGIPSASRLGKEVGASSAFCSRSTRDCSWHRPW